MKRVNATIRGDGITHIEAPGCIVNIHTGLTNRTGQSVTAISIVCDQYAGEPKWTLPDLNDTKSFNVRVMCDN